MTWYQKFKESVFFRKLFLLAFVTSMILFRTLLNRNLWLNPLSDVMGGWGIWETVNGEQKLTTECIENVIMMVPFSAVVMWTFKEKIGNGWKRILWQSGKIAFIFSLSMAASTMYRKSPGALAAGGRCLIGCILSRLSGDKKTMRRSRNRKEAEKTNNKCFQRGGSKKGPPFYFRMNRHQTKCTRYL